MKSVFIVYQCESYDEELLISVHATLESAKSKQQMLYAYIFQNDDVTEEDYDGSFEIKCHEVNE
jgi:hypothetical protein